MGMLFLIFLKWKADTVGSFIFTLIFIVSVTYFKTDFLIALLSSLAGIVKSFPISLMVLTSIFMMTYMQKTGALAKIVISFKKVGSGNKAFQIMLINLAFGTFLVSIGATPVTMLPPVLIAMGYSPFAAVALPAIGYDPLCTFALLAVPAVFFAEFMGISLTESGFSFSFYMPLVTLGIALGMLWLAGGKKLLFNKESFLFASVGGLSAGGMTIVSTYFGIVTLAGVISGIFSAFVLVLTAKLRKIKIIDSSILTEEDRTIDMSMPLLKALCPWLFLIFFIVITNLISPIALFLSKGLPLTITIGEIPTSTAVFSHAYFWVLISTFCSMPILGWKNGILKSSTSIWIKRSVRPVYAAAIFFAIAYLIIYSGTNSDWIKNTEFNMITILSTSSALAFGRFYPLIVPFIGLFGGFISGSETSAIAMFTAYHKQTALKLGINPIAIGTANGVGGGLASVLSPAKVQNAAAVIDEIGIEGDVIKKTAPISFLMTLSVAATCLCWANSYPWWGWLIVYLIYFSIIGLVALLLYFKTD